MELYFRLIQFSLGLYEGKEFLDGTALKDFDWKAFFDFVKKQTLVGIAMDGVQKLPKGVAPNENLLLIWFGLSHKLMMRNSILNKATVYVYKSPLWKVVSFKSLTYIRSLTFCSLEIFS